MRTLTNAVARDRVHHAYLFVGSRGTGKTSMAKILAACLNCVARADGRALRRLRLVHLDRLGQLARRDRDGRRVVELGRRHPRPARLGRLRAGLRAPEGLHPRRGAHALDGGLERVPEDARGAAAEHRLRARDDRGAEGAADRRRPLPPLRLPAPDGRADRHRGRRGRATPRAITIGPEAVAVLARHASGSFRDALGTLEQLQTYAGRGDRARRRARRARASPTPSCCSERSTRSPPPTRAARWPRSRSARRRRPRPGGVHPRAGDARARAADRATLQGGEVPAELQPDARARRAPGGAGGEAEHAASLVRTLDLLAAALTHLRAGADARTQLELALVKAARAGPRSRRHGARVAYRAARARRSRPPAPPRGTRAGAAGGRSAGRRGSRAPASAEEPRRIATRHGRRSRRRDGDPAAGSAAGARAAAGPAAAGRGRCRSSARRAVAGGARHGARRQRRCSAPSSTTPGPVELAGDRLVLAFGEDAAFLRKKAEERATRGAAHRGGARGDRPRADLSYELREGQRRRSRRSRSARTSSSRRLKDEFDAEELGDTDEEER